jgi:hypothetical protein
VTIPYALILAQAMPKKPVTVMRTFSSHILPLIKAIAYLHQFKRTFNEHGELEATVEDYELARRLILGCLRQAQCLNKEWRECKELIKRLPPTQQFNSNEAKAALGAKTRKGTLGPLEKLQAVGLLRLVSKGTGQTPSLWEHTGISVDDLILPSADYVRRRLHEPNAQQTYDDNSQKQENGHKQPQQH